MARISNAVSRSIDRESIDGQSGDIIQPGNTFRTCFQNILKAILRSGWSNFSKMIALIYIFYYLYLNSMIPNCI